MIKNKTMRTHKEKYPVKKHSQKLTVVLTICILTTILISNFVIAFGVSSPYMENRELKMEPGEIKDLQFVLQNSDSVSEITARAEILSGEKLVEITDSSNIYNIPAGGKATVNLKITAPQAAANGDNETIRLGFSTSGTGGFFGSAVEQNFKVVIDENINKAPEQDTTSSKPMLFLILGIVIALAIIFFIVKKSPSSKQQEKNK